MANFLLKPQDGGRDIQVPPGKTTIGRGPFLGVTDKRVSRSHAVLELTDGKLTVLPLHTNPTFYKATEKDKFVSLKKDEAKCLINGNIISLLPESLCFEVICEGSLGNNGLTVEEEETSKSKAREEASSTTDVTVKVQKVATESFLDEFLDDRPSLKTCRASVTQASTSADVTISDIKEFTKEQSPSSPSFVSKKKTSSPSKPLVEPAPLLQKTRKLPAWLTQSSGDTKPPAKKTASSKGKAPVTEKKTITSAKGGRNAQKSTSLARQKQKTPDPDEDFIVSDDEKEHLKQKGKRKAPSKKRASSDLDNSDEEIATTTNKKVKRKSHILESDSDEEDIPARPEKQVDSKPVKPVSEGDSSGSDDEDVKPTSKTRVEAKSSEKDKSETTKLPACPYGNKCYRKNPAHFREYLHPSKDDDDDDDDDDKAAAEGSDDDRPECPYGTSCYRQNPQHKRDYKHTATPGRPSRKKAKHKSVLDGDSDDDDGPNTYDYNDSFLADEGEESESSYSGSEDSDWQPQGDNDDDDIDEDVNELLTEARGFLRSKK